MKSKHLIVLLLSCCFCLFSKAQSPDKDEYRIDASQRPSNGNERVRTQQVYLSSKFEDLSSAVLINKKLYRSAVLVKLSPYIQNDKNIRSIEIIKDEPVVRRYTSDQTISRLIAIRLKGKLRRQFARDHREFAIN